MLTGPKIFTVILRVFPAKDVELEMGNTLGIKYNPYSNLDGKCKVSDKFSHKLNRYTVIYIEIDTHLSTQMFDHKNSQNNLEGNALWLSTFPEKDAMRLLKMDFRNESRGGVQSPFA